MGASAKNEKVVVELRVFASRARNLQPLGLNIDVGSRAEDEFKLTRGIMSETRSYRLEKLIVGDLPREQATRCRNVPVEMAVTRHESDLEGAGCSFRSLLENAMRRADSREGASHDDNVLHGARDKTWVRKLTLKVVRSEEVEGGGDGALKGAQNIEKHCGEYRKSPYGGLQIHLWFRRLITDTLK